MPIDPELKALLTALAEGQIKLAENVQQLTVGYQKLTENVQQLTVGYQKLTENVQQLTVGLALLTERMDRFDLRMRDYTTAVIRKLNEPTTAELSMSMRVDAIEDRLATLEQARRV